jgi:hypothetical protein
VARKELVCNMKSSCVTLNYGETDKSVVRIRLVTTENPNACVTVNCKVCRSAIVLYCL